MPKSIVSTAIAFVLGFAAIFVGLSVYQKVNTPAQPPADLPGFLWPNPKTIGDFALSDQHSKPFARDRVGGKWTFWYFGYTNCPDACPMAMTTMSALAKKLEDSNEAKDFQFSFVSVDPARDSVEHLNQYVAFFNEDFIAATGDDAALQELARQFGVLYVLQEPDEDGNYLVDHTAAYLLTDPDFRFVGLFRQPHDVDELYRQFLAIKNFMDDA